MEATEGPAPIALLVLGILVFVAYGFWGAGIEGAQAIGLLVGLHLAFGVALGLAGCFLTAHLMGASFGYLNTAIIKLAAVAVFPNAVSLVIPYVGWLVAALLYWGLLACLFDLDLTELLVLVVVLWILRFVGAFLVVVTAASLLSG